MLDYDVIIIGAGAAGLYLGGLLKDKKVLILEKNKVPGRKLLVSGGGRANFTNIYLDFKNYHSSSKKFFKYALSEYKAKDFIDFVEAYKIPYFEKKLGQLFCKTSAKDLLHALMSECEKNNLEFKYSEDNISVIKEEKNFLVNGLSCEKLVIASGGLSFPKLGATDFGYKIARQFGHKITQTYPALVGLRHPGFTELAGNSLIAKVKLGKYVHTEDLLFTHKGFSGPLILKTSLFWLPGEKISLDFLPGQNLDELISGTKGTQLFSKLENSLSKKIAAHFFKIVEIDPKTNLQEIPKKKLNKLKELIHNYQFIPEKTDGYDRAEVTRGGVITDDIDPSSMESKLCKNLYFIGEVLDVTGQLGGHNFQWAWASAYTCSKSM